jgi:hypothetical protein
VMPQSLVTQDNFWNSSARAHILEYFASKSSASGNVDCRP